MVYCEDCTWYSIVLHDWDIPARLEACVMCMHLHQMIQYGWCCGWLPTRWWCVSPRPWQWLSWSSFLIGTKASEYVTAWKQWHDEHVVLCTMEDWHALVRRLKIVRSFLLQYRDAKRSKKKMDASKWRQGDSYTKEIRKNFMWWSKPSG